MQLTLGSTTVTPPDTTVSYAPPLITSAFRLTNASIYTMSGNGGTVFYLGGENFGNDALSLPRVSYGPAALFVPGAEMPFGPAAACSIFTPHTAIRCLTAPGIGANHSLVVSVGGQFSALSNVTIGYNVPRINGVSGIGSRDLDTKGGQVIVFSGTSFGENPRGIYPPPLVTYGVGNFTTNFTAAACEHSGSGATATITCLTGEGAGGVGGLFWDIFWGGQSGAPWRAPLTCKYRPPTIAAFTGRGALDADTAGGQPVIITGTNFGPANVSAVVAYETEAVYNNVRTRLVFTPRSCTRSATAPHEQMTCVTDTGAGAPLAWSITVAEQRNTQPTTAYAPPIVFNASTNVLPYRTPVTVASTEGGTVIRLFGNSFGPAASAANGGRPLVQWVRYGPDEDPYTPRAFTVINDETMLITLAPGIGAGLTFKVSVADAISTYVPSGINASINYAAPTIVSIVPNTAPTVGGVTLRVNARNVGMLDETTEHIITMGGRELPIIERFPSKLAVALNNLTAAMLLPANHYLSVAVPPGVGARLPIVVTAYRRNIPTLRASSTTNPGVAAQFSYTAPVITLVTVEAVDASTFALLNASFGAGFDAADARLLTITCTNAGPSESLGRLEVQLVDSLGRPEPSDPSWNAARAVPLARLWTHDRIVALSVVARGNIRIAIPTYTSTGAPGVPVYSNVMPYTDLSPVITALNASVPGGKVANFSTAGGEAVVIGVTNLASAQGSVNVTVGGAPAAILAADGVAVVPAEQVVAQIVNPQVAAAGTGIDASRVVVRLTVRLPPGQGSAAPVVVYRDGTPGGSSSVVVRYAPPVLLAAAVTVGGNVTTQVFPPANATAGAPGVRVPTTGGRVLLRGANLGVCPVLSFGPSRGAVCTRDALPGDALTIAAFTGDTVELVIPAGEGDGSAFGGWRLALVAGDQSFGLGAGYRAPLVTRAFGTAGRLPTMGGVELSLEGDNFGRFEAPEPIVAILLGGGATVYCDNVQRDVATPHTRLTCTLPAGSGANLTLAVTLADVVGYSTGVLSYDSPVVLNVSTWLNPASGNATDLPANLTVAPPLEQFVGPSSGPTTGGFLVRLTGSGFGIYAPNALCVFVTPSRDAELRCNGQADNFLEGELQPAHILSWGHMDVVFRMPPTHGGVHYIFIVARGQRSSSAATPPAPGSNATRPTYADTFSFDRPIITRVSPIAFSTDGRELVTLIGANFGFGPTGRTNLARALAEAYLLPVPLPLPSADLPSGVAMRVNFFSSERCISSAVQDEDGLRPSVVSTCRSELDTEGRSEDAASPVPAGYGIVEHTHDRITFVSISGVGRDRPLSVSLINGENVNTQSAPFVVSYAPPVATRVSPSLVQMREVRAGPEGAVPAALTVFGRNFGGVDQTGWTAEEREIGIFVDGEPCVESDVEGPKRVVSGSAVGLQCQLGARAVAAALAGANATGAPTVGMKTVTVKVAGQTSPASNPELFQVVCQAGYYAQPGEPCLVCPRGGFCFGYDASKRAVLANRTAPDGSTYIECLSCYGSPVATPGWHNLAGVEAAACPVAFKAPAGRDVCMVPCDPPESCLGKNECGAGYTNKAPNFRCSTCREGFYRRGGLCAACPSGAAAIIVVYVGLIMLAAVGAYLLQKLNVNIAVASIGVDFAQVVAVFASTKVKWPPAVAEFFHVLSAFNLNVEIVAPECFMPGVSFTSKFAGIVLLPVTVMAVFLAVHFGVVAYKSLIKGRRRDLNRHTHVMTASCLMLMYFLYIYETRTLLEVFNCAPTTPPDGKEYLAVVFEECGKPGGTQATLLPFSIIGLLLYTCGYPSFVAWNLFRNREKIMEDQLLRAKGAGNDRLTNPHAYELRKTFSRVYYQFKPDLFWWSLIILLRKFAISFVSVMFNKNAAFQMAACLLVLLCAYGMHLRALPYMGPGSFDDVLRAHKAAVFSSAAHARIHTSISAIESRGRKRVHKNLLNYQGKVDRSAVLGVLSGWLFDYNFVEATLLFGACVVCIMVRGWAGRRCSHRCPSAVQADRRCALVNTVQLNLTCTCVCPPTV